MAKVKSFDPMGPDGPSYTKEEWAAQKGEWTAEAKRMQRMRNDYLNQGSGRVSKGKVKAKYAKGVKSPGRAQPKGTPPRTGPGSGAGGGSGARYTRLTGGGGPRSHGR